MTRLDGIPRTTPIIHALLLATALVAGRSFARMRRAPPEQPARRGRPRPEHIIVIGANRLSSLYVSFLRAYEPDQYRVIALLDDRPEMSGRSLAGVRVLGPVNHLLPIIEEFKEHGISTDRVLVGGNADLLAPDAIGQVQGVCNAQEMRLDFIPQLLGLDRAERARPQVESTHIVSVTPVYSAPRYHRFKRALDIAIGLPLAFVLLPIFLLVAAIVLFDVGLPVLFWQQRVGRNGQSFQLHKFRTLKPSFDWRGRPLAEDERLSSVGRMLRLVRLDELPQLLNVLIGDMSLIGPRPLLPRDQPPNAAVRLSVRPGITGWAQVHGGTLLTPEEKNVLDEWYVRNASLWIDLTIAVKTIGILLAGDRRPAPRSVDAVRDGLEGRARRSSLSGT
jgi:lipopolysaccharide/colanic/teichoic acid biosynthesis glycosyltransferase